MCVTCWGTYVVAASTYIVVQVHATNTVTGSIKLWLLQMMCNMLHEHFKLLSCVSFRRHISVNDVV